MYEFDGLGRGALWVLEFICRGKGDVREKKRRERGRREPCDIQESLEREEPSGLLVIARLPLARRCIFRTEIKVYDARRDLKPNFPRRDRAIARLPARDACAIGEESLTSGISRVKSAREHLTLMDRLASSYFAMILSRHFDTLLRARILG